MLSNYIKNLSDKELIILYKSDVDNPDAFNIYNSYPGNHNVAYSIFKVYVLCEIAERWYLEKCNSEDTI